MHWSELDSISSKLIRHTRALETTFKDWSLGKTSEGRVSEAFVQLGNEFIAAQYRLDQGGVDASDLINVPQELRVILESALAMDASPEVADTYDPEIRHVMAQLFHQLKAKQLQLQAAHADAHAPQIPSPSPRQTVPKTPTRSGINAHQTHSSGSNEGVAPGSASGGTPRAVQRAASDRGVTQAAGPRVPYPRRNLSESQQRQKQPIVSAVPERHAAHARNSSLPQQGSHLFQGSQSNSHSGSQIGSQLPVNTQIGSQINAQMNAQTGQKGLQLSSQVDPQPDSQKNAHSRSLSGTSVHTSPSGKTPLLSTGEIPQGGSPGENALFQLHRNGALERQASKRYSTRQIARMINGSPSDKSTLPTALPTTGVHRTFNRPEFSESSVVKEPSVPETPKQSHRRRMSAVPRRSIPSVSEIDPNNASNNAQINAQSNAQNAMSNASINATNNATNNAPNAMNNAPNNAPNAPNAQIITPNNAITGGAGPPNLLPNGAAIASNSSTPNTSLRLDSIAHASADSSIQNTPVDLEPDLTVFLRVGTHIRKGRVPRPASIAALRLQFVEVCAFAPSGEEAFPEILVQDPATSIDYEVTEATISDVVDGSLLTLNIKGKRQQTTENELKEIKDSLKELATQITTLSNNSNNSNSGSSGRGIVSRGAMKNTMPASAGSPSINFSSSKFTSPVLTGDGKFILEKQAPQDHHQQAWAPSAHSHALSNDSKESLIKELEQLRNASNRQIAAFRTEITNLRTELKKLASASVTVVSNRSSMSEIRDKMDRESSDLLVQLEDISDIIDRQRLDVLSGGYRYSQHELDQVQKMLNHFSDEFKESEQFLRSEQPVWKRVWQAELTEVIESQDWVKNLAALYRDLRTDLENSLQTFALVCEANQIPKDASYRQTLPVIPPIEPGKEQQVADAMFHEIRALNLNSEQRTEAVQRAERHHKAKQALRTEEFEAELNTFVADSKLKDNGGFDEVEKRIQEREQRARKLAEESEIEGKRQAEMLRKERKAQREAARKNGSGNGASKDAETAEDAKEVHDNDSGTANSTTPSDDFKKLDDSQVDDSNLNDSTEQHSKNDVAKVHDLELDPAIRVPRTEVPELKEPDSTLDI